MLHLRSTIRFNLTLTFVATLHVIQLLLYFKNANPLQYTLMINIQKCKQSMKWTQMYSEMYD